MANYKIIWALAFACVLLTVIAPAASAHRVYAQEQVTEVQIRSWYGGGDPMPNAEINIYAIKNGEEELYITDMTDEEGLYYFEPKLGVVEYRVVVSKSGHQKEITFNVAGSEGSGEEAELPLSARIIAGFGYLVGLAGFGMYRSARKTK
ncbi:carboxypeptidase-like regulatory domain-containing protein [Methanococcoides sp. NM1]|uniref:carboxypeptidase-like regulatory domain-containing protein n=1 Tax=Methanococcoides sp. NM1 TaxID=1201013 RepID=UPI001083F45A|nr:carboxypeptidase-like regulatory domain-containing protein [Methanococcoides sp. NM1]